MEIGPNGLPSYAEALVGRWLNGEPERARSRVGIPNAALQVLEIFRSYWPLRETHYLTLRGGQVAGLSGASGDKIVLRHSDRLRSMGTEAGRTSRSTPAAARRLATLLNELPHEIGSDSTARTNLANAMQAWIVNEVLAPQLQRTELAIVVRPGRSLRDAIDRFCDDSSRKTGSWAQVASSLLTKVVAVAARADTKIQLGKQYGKSSRTLLLGDASIVVSALPTLADIEACRNAISADRDCLLVTRSDRVLASIQLLDAAELQCVEVESLSRFLSRMIEYESRFNADRKNELIGEINKHL